MTAPRPATASCLRPHLDRRERVSSYFALGILGVLVGAILVVVVGVASGASQTTVLIAVVAPQVGLLVGIKVVQIVTGEERIVLYQQLLAALGASALACHVADQPVWRGVDLAALGCAGFLAWGRVGCLLAGCCYGRPARWGVVYTDTHERAGFPRHYVGVRLFPLQLVDALANAGLAAAMAWTLLQPHAPGAAVALYFAVYGAIRFALELARGDHARPYWLGLSEAQWTALVTVWVSVAIAGVAPEAVPAAVPGAVYVVAAALVTILAVALVLATPRLARRPFGLRHPHRVAALAQALDRLDRGHGDLRTTETPDGLRISLSVRDRAVHYGVSSLNGELDDASSRAVAAQIALLRHPGRDYQVVAGSRSDMHHVLFAPPADPE